MRIPQSRRAGKAMCPNCHGMLEPEAAEKGLEVGAGEPKQRQGLPISRAMEPEVAQVRGPEKESWERQIRQVREPDFKDRLGSTQDPSLAVDPANPPLRRKKVSRRELKEKDSTEWDEQGRRRHLTLKQRLKRMPWGLVGLFLALLITAVWVGVRPLLAPGSAMELEDLPQPKAPTPSQLREEDRLELKAIAEYLPELNASLEAFLKADSLEKLAPLIREPERVAPLMQDYYGDKPVKPTVYRRLPEPGEIFSHKRFLVAAMETPDFEPILVSVEKTPAGFRVDWESFVGYSEMTWEEFRRTRPKTPQLFRVVLEPGSYFNEDFTDFKKLRCYRLADKRGAHVIQGYTPMRSRVDQQIMEGLLNKRSQLCVLRLRFTEESTNDKQVEITEFLENGWVFREDDAEIPREVTEGKPTKDAGPAPVSAEKKAEAPKFDAQTEIPLPLPADDPASAWPSSSSKPGQTVPVAGQN